MSATNVLIVDPPQADLERLPRLRADIRAPAAPREPSALPRGRRQAEARVLPDMVMLFDISDLVYYIGHHPNLTGIQRVQSSIVLAMMSGGLVDQDTALFLSFNPRSRKWLVIATPFLLDLLQDMFLPEGERRVSFPADEARYGMLPGAREFDGADVLDGGRASVLCLLGAAWVQRDYFHRVLTLKRRFRTRFVMMVHDLIPIYARETCDQGTARVFEEFLRRAMWHVDHYLSVSHNTAQDLVRYVGSLGMPAPPITISRNGSSFNEFLQPSARPDRAWTEDLPERFVLFVATIEGRKNHQFMLDIWRRMLALGDDPPSLVCVGRLGWKSQGFIGDLVESNYLDGKVVLLQEISDAQLKLLYGRCLFTVCPSLYEGWGLPVGESLAARKICVVSRRASLPEVAGEFGTYIDVDDLEASLGVVRELIASPQARSRQEAKIRQGYKPITWRSVAEAVVGACAKATAVEWRDPYPYAAVPYSAEVSFAWLGRDTEGTFGNDMLRVMVDTRRGHFLHDALQERSFMCGEEVRTSGAWAEPEAWGTWLCLNHGELVLGLGPNDSRVYYLFLTLRTSGPAGDLSVAIQANGEAAWQGVIGTKPRDIMMRVVRRTRGASAGGWRLKLRVQVGLSAEKRADIAAVDVRVPTVGFERMVVVPETDLKARLDVLSNLLL
jgi:glycosyltransferase involved in cell wall biosynthesis